MTSLLDAAQGEDIARDRFIERTLAWLRTRLPEDVGPITGATRLFAPGMLDSIRVLELIAWTESAIGRQIPDRLIRMDHFETVNAISATFVEADAEAAAKAGTTTEV